MDSVETLLFLGDCFSSDIIKHEREVEHESIHVLLSGPGTFFVNAARRITLGGLPIAVFLV